MGDWNLTWRQILRCDLRFEVIAMLVGKFQINFKQRRQSNFNQPSDYMPNLDRNHVAMIL